MSLQIAQTVCNAIFVQIGINCRNRVPDGKNGYFIREVSVDLFKGRLLLFGTDREVRGGKSGGIKGFHLRPQLVEAVELFLVLLVEASLPFRVTAGCGVGAGNGIGDFFPRLFCNLLSLAWLSRHLLHCFLLVEGAKDGGLFIFQLLNFLGYTLNLFGQFAAFENGKGGKRVPFGKQCFSFFCLCLHFITSRLAFPVLS